MNPDHEAVLRELEQFAQTNDAAQHDRSQRMLNITRDTGELLSVLVRATRALRVLEVGTSNGYSTLWLADAVLAIGGRVTTVEYAAHKIALAADNFQRTGLGRCIEQVHGDAGPWLAHTPSDAFDFVFLDSERTEYCRWWPDLRRVLRPGGLLVVDNALSHASEIAPLVELLNRDRQFTCCTVAVGNGELLATRAT